MRRFVRYDRFLHVSWPYLIFGVIPIFQRRQAYEFLPGVCPQRSSLPLVGQASRDFERLSNMQQEIEEELARDKEILWQIIPLACPFILHYTFRQEGARLLPQLLEAKQRASRSTSGYATHIVRQFLALVAVEAGRLHLAYEESLAALDLIKQLAGYALLKGYFEMALAQVFYQWDRLVEARDLLHTMMQKATAWQQLDLLSWGHAGLIQVEIARGAWSAAEQALHEVEQLVQRERFGTYW